MNRRHGNETERNRGAFEWLLNPPTDGPPATVLLRTMAGGVFLWEGMLKFVYANQGVGRFTRLGFPWPHLTANVVAALEIGGGLLLLAGALTRVVTILFVVEMLVAMLATKISLFNGTSPLPLPPSLPKVGFWAVLHESRSEYAQLLTSAFLMIAGPGRWSIDALRARASQQREDQGRPGIVSVAPSHGVVQVAGGEGRGGKG
jgi:putative oxidoreductase